MHETIDLSNLFSENDNAIAETEHEEAGVKESVVDLNSGQLGTNILDCSSSQLISDQKKDVTLHNLTILNVPPEDIDGYFYANGIVIYRKFTKHPHDGLSYIDRVVAPEAYRPEILRLGHSIPFAGHMGQEKTYERISRHFTWPRLYTEVKDFCATCPQCCCILLIYPLLKPVYKLIFMSLLNLMSLHISSSAHALLYVHVRGLALVT